jgi:radical SAM superfamily enzyme with C-terminal helix-hairpin-helix motif
MLEDRVKYLEEKLDKEIEYSKVMVKRVIGFMMKEQEEKDAEEEASKKKKEASYHSKKGETTKDMVAKVLQGCLGLEEVVLQGRSKAYRSIFIFIFCFLCVINFCKQLNMTHA